VVFRNWYSVPLASRVSEIMQAFGTVASRHIIRRRTAGLFDVVGVIDVSSCCDLPCKGRLRRMKIVIERSRGRHSYSPRLGYPDPSESEVSCRRKVTRDGTAVQTSLLYGHKTSR
jgi:hypothetical protein